MDNIKIGLLGIGNMGQNHLRVLSLLKDIDLEFIYDIDVNKSKRLSKQYDVRISEDLEDDLKQIDAVVIATPTFTHQDYILKISNHVKNIFVEKPMTDSLSKSEKILKLIKQKKLKLQVGFIERFNPAVVALKRAVSNSRIINIDFTRTNRISSRISDVDVVVDLMIHDIDLALSFNGDVDNIEAYGTIKNDMIVFARATLKHTKGAFSNITASRITEKRIRHIAATCDDLFIDCNLLSKEVHINKQTTEQYYKDFFISSRQETINVNPEEALLSELLSFIEYIRGNSVEVPSAEQDVMVMEVAKKIKRQIQG